MSESTPRRLAGLRFLVVEDHEFQRKTLGEMVARLGAREVLEASDGQAALEILGRAGEGVHVIVSDVDMPGMDGMEFMRHVGSRSAPVCVVLASALDRSLIAAVETMTSAYGVRILGVIEKPVTPQKLLAALSPPERAAPDAGEAQPRIPLSLEEIIPSQAKQETFTLEEIASGLENDQFEPFFQPKVELATGRVVGAEALARWRHPEMGKVAPFAFNKPLQDSGRIDELTRIMLRKAADCCRAWREGGSDIHVSVKLAVRSLADHDLSDRVTELVAGRDLEPRHMVLEIIEPAAVMRAGPALENLARLRMRGFGLSINDYANRYSALQQLTRIAFTELKVDQAFARSASADGSAGNLLAAMLEQARGLGIASVVEGVETQQDWNLLKALGFDFAQGYFVAAPMDAAAHADWLRAHPASAR